MGIEADPSFNIIGRIRGPNVSPGALRLIVIVTLRTLVPYLGTLYLISKDFRGASSSIFCMVAVISLAFHTFVMSITHCNVVTFR